MFQRGLQFGRVSFHSSAHMYSIGLDYGTNSVRALIVRASDGFELGSGIAPYSHGEAGILLDTRDPDLARQHPCDYLSGAEQAVRAAIENSKSAIADFDPANIAGIGVDTTGSTPLPVDSRGHALAENPLFEQNLNAMAWLWKDHTSTQEATALTQAASREHPEYLAKCGGTYSSEWFWSKIWHCAVVAPEVSNAAHSWIELADWVPAILTGTEANPARGICSAGHKAMYHESWGGFPSPEFLSRCHPKLGELAERLNTTPCSGVDRVAGHLTPEWARRLGLKPGIPVAVGAIDAHLGAVGSGIRPGTLVKILGTSTCDMMVHPLSTPLADVPGICGIVPGSIVPGFHGLEAGQSAVGDLFNWFVSKCAPPGAN
jgi:L-ribulokinase